MTEQQAENIVEAIDSLAATRAVQLLKEYQGKHEEAVQYDASAIRLGELLKEALMETKETN